MNQISAQAAASRESARREDGKFGEQPHDKSDVTLGSEQAFDAVEQAFENQRISERAQALLDDGYLPAFSRRATQNPNIAGDDDARDTWWANQNAQGEYSNDGKGYEKMPDDWTPSRHSGKALSGHRRTHRMKYEGAGISMRMPSATSIRSFAETQNGKSFDVPVEATYPGGSVSGWVRCTRGEDGTWMTEGLDFKGDQRQVAEAVSAVLEARSVRTALKQWESMDDRRAERLARSGAKLHDVSGSSFIKGIGTNPVAGVTFTKIRDQVYVNQTVTDVRAFRASPSKGKEYNAKIKSQPSLGKAKHCDKCNGYYAPALGSHICMRGSATRERQELHDDQLEKRRRSGAGFMAGLAKVFGRQKF